MPIPDHPPHMLALQAFLPYRLSNLAERISQALSTIYAQQYDLTIAQWRVLAWLQQTQPLTAKRICQLTDMDKARVSRAVAQLVERRLVRRQRDTTDQRTLWLTLTTEGNDLLASVIPRALAWESELIANLSPAEYRELFRLLAKVEAGLKYDSPADDDS
ncbi:MarR family winged helix-turn-helix transcriptional regulator [Halomonas sp. HP20-15]|uniref:MarR family winged helix-turn-helix transcriptional regulator n=1 Tax=Halomonas sp. HP20-15 TaxID=3085901 RepID=UPI0029822306|nr:MarR family winged helix-turn-helix transcriptional regulator [Halomonas sp. HP20-15]MDW5376602.1 MarR family winged helix-turn-helix transcriptional regulator [Halomonas sp. HP20-15]